MSSTLFTSPRLDGFRMPAEHEPQEQVWMAWPTREDNWRERPFVSNSNCFVVPPMKFATESCEVMERCIEAGMPVLLL